MIKNIPSLINNLKKTTNYLTVYNVLRNYNGIDYRDRINFKDDIYNREYIYKSDVFDALIISWDKDQKSCIHDHPGLGCFMKILDGNLKEDVFDHKYRFLYTTYHKKNKISYINDHFGLHKITQVDTPYTISLHVYFKDI